MKLKQFFLKAKYQKKLFNYSLREYTIRAMNNFVIGLLYRNVLQFL